MGYIRGPTGELVEIGRDKTSLHISELDDLTVSIAGIEDRDDGYDCCSHH
jgi:hypothetical protein